MTVRTADTPFIGKGGRRNYLSHKIENRNIGAHLVCGNIDTYVSFNTNNLVPGGANIIIEVTKRCIEIIAEMLGKSSGGGNESLIFVLLQPINYILLVLVAPKTLYVQYDNCGENKVILHTMIPY
jgi:hypothetical protein